MSRGEKRTIREPPYSRETVLTNRRVWNWLRVSSLPSVQVSPIRAHENFRTYTKHASPIKKKEHAHDTRDYFCSKFNIDLFGFSSFSLLPRDSFPFLRRRLVKLDFVCREDQKDPQKTVENRKERKPWAERGSLHSLVFFFLFLFLGATIASSAPNLDEFAIYCFA